MTQRQLQKYAELVLFGLGDVRGKNVRISLEEPGIELARVLAEECYKNGALIVKFNMEDNYLKKALIDHGSDDALMASPSWLSDEIAAYADGSWMLINIRASEHSSINQNLSPERSAEWGKAQAALFRPLQIKAGTFQIPWIIVLVPTYEKAIEAFPDLSQEDAYEKYSKGIIDVLQLNDDPVEYWRNQFARLSERRTAFDKLQLTGLHFIDPELETDLHIQMIPGFRWATAEQILPIGNPVRVNIPSCEIYTSPHREGTEGFVRITKPFIPVRLPGSMVKNGWMRFENGRVVETGADSGADTFKSLLELDENAAFLGEVALVEKTSAVARQDFLFHSILFDENASSHIAIGNGFPSLIPQLSGLNNAELIKEGLNQSIQHQDMMIGTEHMELRGTDAQGREILLMKDGLFMD